jgi:Transposase DDE domain
MPRHPQLYAWADRVATAFPELPPATAFVLALWSFGLVLAHACGLTAVVAHLAPLLGRSANTTRQRLREFYHPADRKRGANRTALDPATCCGPLVRWVTAGWAERRVAVALDATSLGDRFTVLAAAVLYRGCGVPVAWAVLPANTPGAWHPYWVALLGRVAAALGPGWEVVVLTDRGLESPALFRAIAGLGMHPLMRVKAGGHFRPDGWAKFRPLGQFAARDGARFAAAGVAYAGARLRCTLLACRRPGCADPWLLLTDLPVCAADPCWYAFRGWVEQGFKVVKSAGWQWHKTRMTDPDRAARLWAAVATATVWLVEVGGLAESEPRPETIPRFRSAGGRRVHRVFRVGLGVILAGLLAGRVMVGRFVPEPWPAPVPIPPVTETMFHDT